MLKSLLHALVYLLACILVCAAVASAWIAIATPAHCTAAYCGTCDFDLSCPSGCACDVRSETCVRAQ